MTAQARLLGGRYQVGELLGYGGMAEVHRGRDLRLGRDVAIKTLRTDLARDATFQLRFRREAQNAAALNHPAIVAVYDTGDERGPAGEELPYIVMEFVNGRTLKEVIRASHLVRIQADHIEHTSGATHLRVAEHALLLPPLVATLALTQRDRDDLRSVFGRASASHTRWLFPGIRPGLAMDAHSLAFKLNDHGINVRAARNTALGELAADLPPPVLAELVGIGITTATRWARYASRDWRPYLAARCGISSILSVRTSLT